jgi:hypothetical protein
MLARQCRGIVEICQEEVRCLRNTLIDKSALPQLSRLETASRTEERRQKSQISLLELQIE